MEDHVDEQVTPTDTAAPVGEVARDYAELGERVAAVLAAAEAAADEIQADALRKADALRRRAETEARAMAEDEQAKAAAAAGRLRQAAISDAEAIRDAAQAAAGRVAQEGQRRLGDLRKDGRALEGRFEAAVDDLHDLIAQLEAVVRNAVAQSGSAEAPPEPEAETDPGHALADDLWPASEPVADVSDGQNPQLR